MGEILSTKGQYHNGWAAMNADNSFVGAHKSRKLLEDYLMALAQKRRLQENRRSLDKVNSFRWDEIVEALFINGIGHSDNLVGIDNNHFSDLQ